MIFITESDYFGESKPLYRVERKRENNQPFEDGSHIIYVNGKYEGDDAIGHLLSDFRKRDLSGFYYSELEQGVLQFKEEMEGRTIMCEAVEKYAKKYAEGKYDSGKLDGRLESIHAIMKNLHLSAEEAMESIGIPKDEQDKYKKML